MPKTDTGEIDMEKVKQNDGRQKTGPMYFLSGTEGTVPRRALLFCPADGSFSLSYAVGSARLVAGRNLWQLHKENVILVRAGQTCVLSTNDERVSLTQIVVGGEQVLPAIDGNAAVFVPRAGGAPLSLLFSRLLTCLPGECEDELLQQFVTSLTAGVRLSPPMGTRPPDPVCLLKEIFDTRYAEKLTLDSLAEELHWNKYKLEKDFKKYLGCPPFEYLLGVRVKAACRLLCETDDSVLNIGFAVGVDNPSYFIRIFKQRIGMSPLEYRTRSAGRSVPWQSGGPADARR
jgi:AraC-like DNA-binding protein